ncbi:hypothetical protein [Nocardia sp. NPDC051570]|uniref:hypothetical protein n=1 Tax=Nocardia sp. NPDC051570 TaxID=3364324 RepID=UPI0037B41562
MFEDQQRFILRKISRINYTHTTMIDGYEDAEPVYKRFRDLLGPLSDHLKELLTYEYGGRTYKQVMGTLDLVGERVGSDRFHQDDIYAGLGLVAKQTAERGPSSGATVTGASFSAAFLGISQYKQQMNIALDAQLRVLKGLKDRAAHTDKSRMQVNNLRFDLETLRQSKAAQSAESVAADKKLEQEFTDASTAALTEMTAFIGDDGVEGVLQKIAEAHREFSEKSAQALKSVG